MYDENASGCIISRRETARRVMSNSGVALDQALVQELASPGTDKRCGINFICRPNKAVTNYIRNAQDLLREVEPDQYFYPCSDLHLTLFEICHSRTLDEVSRIADTIQPQIKGLMEDLPPPHFASPSLFFDATGAAVVFLYHERLQFIRETVTNRLSALGVPLSPRYAASSAHITVLRYLKPLKVSNEDWANTLIKVPSGLEVSWYPASAWLTWGANWYGMRSRISCSEALCFLNSR